MRKTRGRLEGSMREPGLKDFKEDAEKTILLHPEAQKLYKEALEKGLKLAEEAKERKFQSDLDEASGALSGLLVGYSFGSPTLGTVLAAYSLMALGEEIK